MSHYIELARFTVKDGAEAEMLEERPAMVEAIRRHYPAHLDAHLVKLDDGTWIDVVVWSDREQAEAAAKGVYDLPDIAGWFRHTEEELGFEYGHIAHFAPASE